MVRLETASFYVAWGLLLFVFACAYVQGADFASDKQSATVFGCVIGLAAFFSWLAVEDDPEDDELVADAADAASGTKEKAS